MNIAAYRAVQPLPRHGERGNSCVSAGHGPTGPGAPGGSAVRGIDRCRACGCTLGAMNALRTAVAAPARRRAGVCGTALRGLLLASLLLLTAAAAHAQTLPARIAPGFTGLPAGARVALMPLDVELYSISAGGVVEPRADWSVAARRHLRDALAARLGRWQAELVPVDDADGDDWAEALHLQAALIAAVYLHHAGDSRWALPAKAGALDWSLGEALAAVAEHTGAGHALFVRLRDSHASAERKAAIVAYALLGVPAPGGAQTGHAALFDLRSGRLLWHHRIDRRAGDLRTPEAARETVETLLDGLEGGR